MVALRLIHVSKRGLDNYHITSLVVSQRCPRGNYINQRWSQSRTPYGITIIILINGLRAKIFRGNIKHIYILCHSSALI